ncbi:hypothetical protein BST12_05685 [Mycobacterium angelicum]|uniref:Uncharacterized protein n=1 Tax=Mycobacterium angelicum TaxID=470074 RepID=A0A1X0A3C7_MYCAN|nr:hypothetical protein BST12_05685 [Mycobacterium angelicum]
MDVKVAARRLGRAERKVVRLQRRIWLVQLVLWPAGIAAATTVFVGAWFFWRRKQSPDVPVQRAEPPTMSETN